MKRFINRTIQQSYLDQYIKVPRFNDEKLFMLIAILNHTKLPYNIKKQYILTTMLVQIALDSHDLVPVNANSTDNSFAKPDQLTVLAGDYYSGLYYYLLSEIDDLPMVRQLATAIKDINEHKMSLYYGDDVTINAYIDHIERIQTLLITRVAQHVQLDELIDIARDWVLIHTLFNENKHMTQNRVSSWFSPWLDSKPKTDREQMLHLIEQRVEQGIKRLQSTLPKMFEQSILEQQSYSRFYDFLFQQTEKKEEGYQ
ncbi:heptaprenyl diphosphate synthase component 1 [Lentibacillus saliphilus]|uniref:heptaprenyl diphosphate synthase component 1 n=1 Tax=Lentibacillus saliphilus TaxID=2737028 RepID=UPI001C2FDE17|nr:heptaprenyl diphosphate synthase component 1 [Lentibacillus saliphilus]